MDSLLVAESILVVKFSSMPQTDFRMPAFLAIIEWFPLPIRRTLLSTVTLIRGKERVRLQRAGGLIGSMRIISPGPPLLGLFAITSTLARAEPRRYSTYRTSKVH